MRDWVLVSALLICGWRRGCSRILLSVRGGCLSCIPAHKGYERWVIEHLAAAASLVLVCAGENVDCDGLLLRVW
jgi:hypothetical protein